MKFLNEIHEHSSFSYYLPQKSRLLAFLSKFHINSSLEQSCESQTKAQKNPRAIFYPGHLFCGGAFWRYCRGRCYGKMTKHLTTLYKGDQITRKKTWNTFILFIPPFQWQSAANHWQCIHRSWLLIKHQFCDFILHLLESGRCSGCGRFEKNLGNRADLS